MLVCYYYAFKMHYNNLLGISMLQPLKDTVIKASLPSSFWYVPVRVLILPKFNHIVQQITFIIFYSKIYNENSLYSLEFTIYYISLEFSIYYISAHVICTCMSSHTAYYCLYWFYVGLWPLSCDVISDRGHLYPKWHHK